MQMQMQKSMSMRQYQPTIVQPSAYANIFCTVRKVRMPSIVRKATSSDDTNTNANGNSASDLGANFKRWIDSKRSMIEKRKVEQQKALRQWVEDDIKIAQTFIEMKNADSGQQRSNANTNPVDDEDEYTQTIVVEKKSSE